MSQKVSWQSEFFALVFGILMVLVLFGDKTQIAEVGNLDCIFGQALGHLMDVIYPIASMAIFILYGKSKGVIKFRDKSILWLLTFFAGQVIIQFDDIYSVVFNHTITLPNIWWTMARILYFVIAVVTFFAFGAACEKNGSKAERE
jgi:hypothetical protein